VEPARARATVVVAVVAAAVGAVSRVGADGEAPAPCATPARRDGVIVCDGRGDDVGDAIWLFGGRLDLNTASAASLARVKGIGEATARRIVEHRERHGPYRAVDDLDAVDGVGPKTLERLRAVVEVR
jgi:competence protein ComEA